MFEFVVGGWKVEKVRQRWKRFRSGWKMSEEDGRRQEEADLKARFGGGSGGGSGGGGGAGRSGSEVERSRTRSVSEKLGFVSN